MCGFLGSKETIASRAMSRLIVMTNGDRDGKTENRPRRHENGRREDGFQEHCRQESQAGDYSVMENAHIGPPRQCQSTFCRSFPFGQRPRHSESHSESCLLCALKRSWRQQPCHIILAVVQDGPKSKSLNIPTNTQHSRYQP